MSVRSSMASSVRSAVLPESVQSALALRSGDLVCPEDVERAISAHNFFKHRPVALPAPRFGRMPMSGGGGGGGAGAGSGGEGRFGGFRHSAPRPAPVVTEDGFETVGGRRRGGGAFTDRRGGGGAGAGAGAPTTAPPPTPVLAPATAPEVPAEPAVAKFSSAALRAGLDIEDRMLARVKGKINRLGHGTYDATKVFMQQILSSDDTDFLDELMKYIFTKASNESAYCPLYASLLHELGDEFPHFRTVIYTIFTDYINVFKEVDAGTEPDPGSADYKAFLEAQERKRARRGYSQFVAELVKLGEADVSAFMTLMTTIVSAVEMSYNNADKTLTCEEYIDCLSIMCSSASAILRSADWSAPLVHRIAVLAAKPKKSSAGLSNKARFAIMDLSDSASAGWTFSK
jgi:hypothetical protein